MSSVREAGLETHVSRAAPCPNYVEVTLQIAGQVDWMAEVNAFDPHWTAEQQPVIVQTSSVM